MITEKIREEALSKVEAFKHRPDYIELYLYLVYGDKCFLTDDLKKNGKPSAVAIKKKVEELAILLARHIIIQESECNEPV